MNPSIYKLLAHFTILLHFLWILFLIFGVFFALRRPKIALFHLAGLFFSLILNIFGWYCPFTYLENYLRCLHDVKSTYSGPFIANYLELIIYPDLPVLYIRAGEILFVIFYGIFYAYLAKKHHIFNRRKRS